MFSTIQPNQYVALRLPSDAVKVEQIVPNNLINLGKYGSFHANQILGRPFYRTFEILERAETQQGRELRIIPAAELHADALLEEAETSTYGEDASTPGANVPNGSAVTPEMKSNINTVDDPSNQKLSMAEIEALKMDETGSSRDLINKILQSHSTLEQKTAFSLAKYTLRKHKKYLKRFCVLPLDVASMTDWQMQERDFSKVLEIRNEMLGLMGSWANIHAAGLDEDDTMQDAPSCRYLVVDDTGGLVIAAMAERMGILHSLEHNEETPQDNEQQTSPQKSPQQTRRQPTPRTALSNTITLIHANSQPNLSLLRYFGYDSNNPSPTHPLTTHLNTLSWLQLLDPQSDPSYAEPELIPPQTLHTWKSSKRSTYHRKRRRWERIRTNVDTTRLGGFNGLILASYTSAPTVLHRLVPLLAGGAQIAVYSPHIEPLVTLADLYSTARRTAFIQLGEEDPMRKVPSEDFPVDPTLLLTPSVQTGRVRKWQVLPGRTHPLMMGKGGAEGYLFVGTRVVPAEGRVAARGKAKRGKGRKGEMGGGAVEVNEPQDGQAERENKRFKLEDEDGNGNGNEHAGAEAMDFNMEPNADEAQTSAQDVDVEVKRAIETEFLLNVVPGDVIKREDGAKDAKPETETGTATVEADTSHTDPINEATSGVAS